MTKDELIEELQAMLIGAMDAADRVQEAADHRLELEVKAVTLKFATERLAEQKEMDARLHAVGNGIQGLRDRISRLPKDQRDAMGMQLAELSALVKQSLDGGPERPLLLDELDRWIELRAGHAAEKKIRTDRNRILDFEAFAGNRPVNKYRYSDFQAFANLLARVPANYSKEPRLRGMTRQEAADFTRFSNRLTSSPIPRHGDPKTGFSLSIDILVNNAFDPSVPSAPILDLSTEQLQRDFEMGPIAYLRLMQACHPFLKASGEGRVINFGSMAGVVGLVGYGPYNMAKEAVRALTRTAAREWGADGITVNNVLPVGAA